MLATRRSLRRRVAVAEPAAKRRRRNRRSQMNPIHLPSEVLEKIFRGLRYVDIVNCERVNWHWRSTIGDDVFWKNLLFRHFKPRHEPSGPKLGSWREDYENLHHFKQPSPDRELSTDGIRVVSVAFSHSGRYLVCGTKEDIIAWDVENSFAFVSRTKLRNTRRSAARMLPGKGTFSFRESDDMLLAAVNRVIATENTTNNNNSYDKLGFAILFSFPALKEIKQLTFDSPGATSSVCLGWFGLFSILAEVEYSDRQANRNCLIYPIDGGSGSPPLNPPKTVTRNYCKVGVVENTATCRKHVVTSDRHDFDWTLRSIVVKGPRRDTNHACARCAYGMKSCLSTSYATRDVSVFRVRLRATTTFKNSFHVHDMITRIPNRIFLHVQRNRDQVALLELTTDLSQVRELVFPSIRHGYISWMDYYVGKDGSKMAISNVSKFGQSCDSVILHDGHYDMFVEKRITDKSHALKKATAIQPVSGKWLVTNGLSSGVKCLRYKL